MTLKEFNKIDEKNAKSAADYNAAWLEFITSVASRLRKKTYNQMPILYGNYVYATDHDSHLDNRLVVVCAHQLNYMSKGKAAFFPIYNPHAENDDYGWDLENSKKIYQMVYTDILPVPSYCFQAVYTKNPFYIKEF